MDDKNNQNPNNNLQSVSLVNALNSATRSEYPLSNLISEHALNSHAAYDDPHNKNNVNTTTNDFNEEEKIDKNDNFPLS